MKKESTTQDTKDFLAVILNRWWFSSGEESLLSGC